MLRIKNVKKEYRTGELVQKALDDVSLNLRDNEFVAVLGPSGSGKTTLLNVVGGLDRYDSGDLIINDISTKEYKDRDWDSYRNHTIGFVFQSYNLIPHQSVLSNVELALTISGISKEERRKKATEALTNVGLGDHIHKKPNQLSGGQMQRVAIARALVNDPDILLADEPTGALDSETSVQVMELLKEVAKDRLVVMVTHNPELAEKYATRIVKLKDGKIIDDSKPFKIGKEKEKQAVHKNMGKSSMSFFTSLSLSFNNLKTKKGRTILTAFAGSIGIIGIALIISLSSGVNQYINDIQKKTMTSYPISIQAQSFDLASMIELGKQQQNQEVNHDMSSVFTNPNDIKMAASTSSLVEKNNLTDFKKYLDDKQSEIHKYIGENGITYKYDTKFNVYTKDSDDYLVNTDGSTLEENKQDGQSSDARGFQPQMGMNRTAKGVTSLMGGNRSSNNFSELMLDRDGKLSSAITENYDVLHGSLPSKYNEIALVLDKNNEVSASMMYKLGFLPTKEYRDLMKKIDDGQDVKVEAQKWSYEDICKKEFTLVPQCDMYEKNDNGTFKKIEDKNEIEKLADDGIKLKITGIIKKNDSSDARLINTPFVYTKDLTNYLIDYTNKSDIVKAQKDDKEINVLNGMKFNPGSDSDKISDAKKYVSNMGVSEKANFYKNVVKNSGNVGMAGMMGSLSESQMASLTDMYIDSLSDKTLLDVYEKYITPGNYDDNLKEFGVVGLDTPSGINIYADTFENKDNISKCIEDYNKKASEENKITYTDTVALLMSSVTTIVDVISYVLIAFVAVSLIVSSIMIGIITFISVLERTKEIGILRAIGASKRNISQVFNAETFIIGLLSGVIGIGVSLLLLIPGNAVIHSLVNEDVTAFLPPISALVLIVLSVILTLIGGIIPSRKAAKKDPVLALRSE